MKKTKENIEDDDLLPEYEFDYSKAKRNPYFKDSKVFVQLDKEVVDAFKSSESINDFLKSLIKALPDAHPSS